MIHALLDGRKTMTRRLAWFHLEEKPSGCMSSSVRPSPWQKVKPGDRLWVRERTKCIAIRGDEIKVRYDADGYEPGVWLPFPPRLRFTPRVGEHLSMGCYLEASRITLDVSATKIERLQHISEADAIAEGIEREHGPRGELGWKSYETYPDGTPHPHAVAANRFAIISFRELWQSLHGHDSWAENPEVVALTFTVHRCNIDAMPKAA
ncbi:MAG: hypothetical protein KBC46_03195 [Ferrovibrio sp.]|nr:hypothetical protein [Ferrovibrio sp.]